MTETEILAALRNLFPQAEMSESNGSFFWFVQGDQKKRRPFLTLVTTNEHDQASKLERHDVYRLNIGVSAGVYRELFGAPPKPRADWGVLETGYDYGALNQPMPHPIYAPMNWVCILNPTPETWLSLRPLLLDAYATAKRKIND